MVASVVTPRRNFQNRPLTARSARTAEGKGFEPSTGFPAPDFESSGCCLHNLQEEIALLIAGEPAIDSDIDAAGGRLMLAFS
jgi:hypothetical protein